MKSFTSCCNCIVSNKAVTVQFLKLLIYLRLILKISIKLYSFNENGNGTYQNIGRVYYGQWFDEYVHLQICLKYRVKINVLSLIYSTPLFDTVAKHGKTSRIIIKTKQLVVYYFYSLLCSRHERGNLRSGFRVRYKLKLTYLEL